MGKVNRVPTKVWRISESAPMGEWVDLAEARRRPAPPRPDIEQGAWVRSSYDLLDGVDVQDDGESVPDDVFDELFRQDRPAGPKSAP